MQYTFFLKLQSFQFYCELPEANTPFNSKFNLKMKKKELQEAIYVKNDIISNQVKRINLLEEKFTELRQKYFQLKYSGNFIAVKLYRKNVFKRNSN